MKLFLLGVLCFGLALAVPNVSNNRQYPTIEEISYRPGKEYIYQYDTQILTGLTKTSQLQAGFRLSCNARVQFLTSTKVVVQFDKIVLYRINEPVVQWKASERLMPEEFLKELVGEEAVTMAQFLTLPFRFDYEDGEVKRIILEDHETTWSANIKRGFTSLFEMNLEKRYLLEDSFPALKSQVPPHANWYNVLERSTTGECVTLYTVTPNTENNHRYVTKIRDFDRCLDRPVYINSIVDGYLTRDAAKDTPLINVANVQYTVKGEDKKFLILSVVGQSHIVFTPYKNEEHVRTSLNQTLTLRESKFIGHEVQQIREVRRGQHKQETIKMTLPSTPVDCQDPFIPCKQEPKQINEEADVYSVEKIHLHLQMAANNTEQITDEEGLQHLRTVKDMLKRSPQKILKDLWDQLYITKVNPKADIDRLSAEIYWNILPSVGTEASANVVLDICSTDSLMISNCTSALRSLALRNTPTTEIIKKLIQLTRVGRLTQEVRQSAYLTLGSFGYKLTKYLEKHNQQCENAISMIENILKNTNAVKRDNVKKEKKEIEKRCSGILNQYVQNEEKIIDTIDKLLKSPKEQDKLLALKSLGNSGLPRILPILKKYLENVQQPNILRVMAVVAHRRIQYPHTSRQQAIETLLKTYLTTTERNEIRSMAFVILTGLNPEQPILETVAMSLRNEKNSQVSSLVYSFLTSFSNSTYGPDKFFKQNCTSALKFAPEIHTGLEHSFWKRIAHLEKDYKRGHAGNLAMIGDIARYLGVALNWETYNYGLVSNTFEVGMSTEGLSPFLNKLFGPKGLLTKNKSLFDLLKRAPRDISPQEHIRQIFKQLRIAPRSMPVPHGHFYIKMMGHELKYIDFTQILQQIIDTGAVPMSWDQEGLRMGLPININTMYDLSDYQLTLPTEAGLPVSLKLKVMSTVNIEGDIAFKVSKFMLETDRQGQPPIGFNVKVDLKPKMVAELEASMGLDMFYIKPVVGYRGLLKYNAPIQRELKVDLTYKRINLKIDMPKTEEPMVEMLLEPYSEFMLITKKNESPIQMSDRRTIYAPIGYRMQPVSYNYKMDVLGYRLALTGQLPHSLTKTNPMCPLCGRSLINVFWLPLENAPRTIELHAQQILPLHKEVSSSYGQTYQSAHTSQRDQYGRDFSEMPQSGVMKYDKYGRPLPQSPEEILPYIDPVDIKNQPINMQQLCNKFQQLFQQPMPFYTEESARAIVILLDASSKNAKRQVQFESVWRNIKEGRASNMYTRLWRSSIPDYDTQEWQMLTEMGVTYPFQVSEPKDIFNPQWQRQLMKDLEYLISLESHKITNQQINMTILSGLQQNNYPAMVRVPTNRIIESLVPEQLYRLMNISGSTIYNRRWDTYWRHLQPLYELVNQEVRINVDPNIVNQDLSLLDHLTQVLEVQSNFVRDLRDILEKNFVAHAELPIVQFINYYQAKTVHEIREIFHKAIVNDRIHESHKIHHMMKMAEKNLDTIQTLVHQIFQRVTTMSQRLDQDGKPVVVFKPEVLRKTTKQAEERLYRNQQQREHQYYQEQEPSYYTTENRQQRQRQQHPEDFYNLRMTLYRLSLKQVDMIERIQIAISEHKKIDQEQLEHVIENIRTTLNIVDQQLMKRFIIDPIVRQSLLLVTVQNELTVQLLEQWKIQVAEKVNVHEMSKQLETLKEQSVYLGERVSMLFHQDLMQRVVVPNLNQQEFPIYKQIRQTKREVVPELREFQIQLAYNLTNMKKPEIIDSVYNKFEQRLETHLNRLSTIERDLMQLGQIPKLYIVSELVDVLHYLKYATEFGTRTLYSLNTEVRFGHLEKMGHLVTKVQTLISTLSPIFTKYEQQSETDIQQHVAILNTLPIDTRVLDVQDVIVQQKMLQQQLYRFIHNPDLSMETLDRVLSSVTDRCETLQETLNQNEEQVKSALEQRQLPERNAISSIWTQALNQQRNLYESMLTIYKNKGADLTDVSRKTERINDLEEQITELESSHDQAIDNLKNNQETGYQNDYSNNYNNNYNTRQQSQNVLKPITPFEYLPTGVTALVNITWGNGNHLNKNAKAQFMASRSVEQMMYLFKQMQAVVRSQDIVSSINRRLSEEPWLADSIMQRFNTFNHWHLVSLAHKEQLPHFLLEKLQYIQNYLKATFWNQYERQPTQMPTETLFQVMLDISDINKEIDLYVMHKNDANVYQGIPLSRVAGHYPIIQNYRPLKEKIMSFLTFNQIPVKCKVNKEKIHTFDRVSYKLPNYLSQKEALLAADCSEEKSFVVTMVKSKTSLNGHEVKILNEDKTVEIIPGYLDTEVRVNGGLIILKDNVPYISYKNQHYNVRQTSMKIIRKGMRVEVYFPLTGLQVVMEGSFIQVKVSQFFKRRLCGLCGNFDSQMSWEYEGPTTEIYSSPRLFAQSYILKEQERHSYSHDQPEFQVQNDRYTDMVSHYRPKGGAGKYVDDIEKIYQKIPDSIRQLKPCGQNQKLMETTVEQTTDRPRHTQGQCTPTPVTIVKPTRSKRKICFSVQPVDKCPVDCQKPTKKEKVEVQFKCLSAKDPNAIKLKIEATRGPIYNMEDVKAKKESKMVGQHISCQ